MEQKLQKHNNKKTQKTKHTQQNKTNTQKSKKLQIKTPKNT